MRDKHLSSVSIDLTKHLEKNGLQTILDYMDETDNFGYKKRVSEPSLPPKELIGDDEEIEVNEEDAITYYDVFCQNHTDVDTDYNPRGRINVDCNSFELLMVAEDWRQEMERIESVFNVDTSGDEYVRNFSYGRLLDCGEGRIGELRDNIVDRIENLGYDVDTEKSHGHFINTSDGSSTKEYKMWFYIHEEKLEDESDELCSHHLSIDFTEDGPYLSGTVVEGVQHQKDFEQLLTEFTLP